MVAGCEGRIYMIRWQVPMSLLCVHLITSVFTTVTKKLVFYARSHPLKQQKHTICSSVFVSFINIYHCCAHHKHKQRRTTLTNDRSSITIQHSDTSTFPQCLQNPKKTGCWQASCTGLGTRSSQTCVQLLVKLCTSAAQHGVL